MKCSRASVCIHVCWGVRTGCGPPLAGAAASLQENLPGGGTNSTLTQHGALQSRPVLQSLHLIRHILAYGLHFPLKCVICM